MGGGSFVRFFSTLRPIKTGSWAAWFAAKVQEGPMARVTIEDCLENVENMYELVHLATKRARQLYKGSESLVKSRNRIIVTALREIAAGKVLSSFPSQEETEGDLPPMAN